MDGIEVSLDGLGCSTLEWDSPPCNSGLQIVICAIVVLIYQVIVFLGQLFFFPLNVKTRLSGCVSSLFVLLEFGFEVLFLLCLFSCLRWCGSTRHVVVLNLLRHWFRSVIETNHIILTN